MDTSSAGLNKEKWGALNTDIHMSSEQANILDQVIEMFTQPSLMITAGINHVFVVNRVDYVSAGTESMHRLIWLMVLSVTYVIWKKNIL